MPIAGVVIVTSEKESMQVLEKLSNVENVTTYGIHKDNNIITVFEGDSPKALEEMNKNIVKNIQGVLGIYPAYVNYEDEE